MTAVILQPSYIPWRGYFHLIQQADVFVFYDDVQYDKEGWRNRNRIKTNQGTQWLTIPVRAKGNVAEHAAINTIRMVQEQKWQAKHWKTIENAYSKAPHFARYESVLRPFFLDAKVDLLADFTIELTITLARLLGIEHTRFVRSSSLNVTGAKTERLIELVQAMGGITRYLSGPSAKDYIEAERFTEAKIELDYIQYDYPEYPQLYPPFDPFVTVLDLLFMKGPETANYIWNCRQVEPVAPASPFE